MRGRLPSIIDRARTRLTGGRQQPGEPPVVPVPVPFLGHALAFGRDLGGLLRACQASHGDVFTLLVAGQRMTFFLDPHSFVDVLKAGSALTFDGVADEISQRAFGHPPSASAFEPEAMRSVLGEVLRGAALAPLAARTFACTQRRFAAVGTQQWQHDQLYNFVHQHMFVINMEALFGDGAVAPDSEAAFRVLDAAFPLLVAGVPPWLLRGVLAARARLIRAIEPRRPDASAFVRGRDAFFASRVDDHFRNHAQLAGLWAAEANTIPATFWTLYYLLQDPAARAAVLAELAELAGELAGDGLAALADVATMRRLPLCNSAVMEAMRLSSSSLVIREVSQPVTLQLNDGKTYALRAGDRVCLCPEINHRDPELFPDADTFRVDRFVGTDGPPQFFKRGKKVTLALMPFGGGVSMCPGRYMASNEVVQVIAALLTTFEFDVPPHAPPPLNRRRAGLGILPPATDVAFRYRRIAGAGS